MKVPLFTYYYIMYKICHKQYVGLTVDIFCSRWNFYKRNDGKYLVGELCLQEHIFEHFKREGRNYWINTLKTMVPWSLNTLNSVWTTCLSNTFYLHLIFRTLNMFKNKIIWYTQKICSKDLLLLGSFLKVCSWFVVLAAASKCGFIYLAMQVDWKRILVAPLSAAGLHTFGVTPLWENFWLTALFSVCPIYVTM